MVAGMLQVVKETKRILNPSYCSLQLFARSRKPGMLPQDRAL